MDVGEEGDAQPVEDTRQARQRQFGAFDLQPARLEHAIRRSHNRGRYGGDGGDPEETAAVHDPSISAQRARTLVWKTAKRKEFQADFDFVTSDNRGER